jgi:hypothetical protein
MEYQPIIDGIFFQIFGRANVPFIGNTARNIAQLSRYIMQTIRTSYASNSN